MGESHNDLARALDAAIHDQERDRERARDHARRTRAAREALLVEIRDLHDRLLRWRVASGGDAGLEDRAALALQDLGKQLLDLLADREEIDLLAEPPRTPKIREVVAHPVGTAAALVDSAQRPADPPPEPAAPAERPDTRAQDVRDLLATVYQEILTLEENQDFFGSAELHQRVDMLLARLRQVQDGESARLLSEDERHFMTTRFGLLRNLQKRRGLGFLPTLNRRYQADWDSYAQRIARDLGPLSDRIQELRQEQERESQRRRAAQAQAARRRMEGEEILDELRLFACGPEMTTPEGQGRFRRLVTECSACLGNDYEPLVKLLDPYRELVEGRELKAVRRALRKPDRVAEEVVVRPPTPSADADREEALRDAFRQHHALLVGGQRREKAEEILVEHLGLSGLTWIAASELAIKGPASAESALTSSVTSLLIVLDESLGEGLVRRIDDLAGDRAVAHVPAGQRISEILAALPLPSSDEDQVRSVNEALERVFSEHPHELVAAFNSASQEKDYPFGDPESVYRALKFLATTYRDARAGRAACPDLDHALREASGFNYRAHQSASTMGQYSAAYATILDGNRFELPEHLGKGSGRDPRHSIRIAFTYLPEEDQVLIGFLGQHQPTRAS